MKQKIRNAVADVVRFFFDKKSVPMRPFSRRLLCESLEERRLLSANPYVGECFLLENLVLEDRDRDAYFVEEAPIVPAAIPLCVPAASASCAPTLEELVDAANRVEILELSESTLEPDAEPFDPFFAEFGVIIHGQKYAPLTEWLARRADLDEVESAGALVCAQLAPSPISYGALSGGSGGGDVPVCDINVTSSATSSCDHLASASCVNPLRESGERASDSSLVGADYLAITLPGLPRGYESRVTIGGTATLGEDFEVLIPYGAGFSGLSLYNDGFDYSGGSPNSIYFVPINDHAPEADETAVLSFGTPQWQGSGGCDNPYLFNEICTTATATIVDDDQWRIEVAALEDAEGGEPQGTPSSLDAPTLREGSDDQCRLVVSRTDAGADRSGDLSYPVCVKLALAGLNSLFPSLASVSDFVVSTIVGNERVPLTPNQTDDGVEYETAIPVDEEETTLYVTPVADGVVEQEEEPAYFYVASGGSDPSPSSGGSSYECGQDCAEIVVKDADALKLTQVQFYNNLSLVSDMPGASFGDEDWKEFIHWSKGTQEVEGETVETLEVYPIAYSSSAELGCNFKVEGTVDPSAAYSVRFIWKDVVSEWTPITFNSGSSTSQVAQQTLGQTFAEYFGGNKALYEAESTLRWEFRVNGEVCQTLEDDVLVDNYRVFAESVNPLYVTYKTPAGGTKLYHTVVHTGCAAASGFGDSLVENGEGETVVENGEETVFDKIWTKFESRQIPKMCLQDGQVVVQTNAMFPDDPNYQNQTDGEELLLSFYGKPVSAEQEELFKQVEILKAAYCAHNFTTEYDAPSLARYVSLTEDSTLTEQLLKYCDTLCDGWAEFAQSVFGAQGIAVRWCTLSVDENKIYERFNTRDHYDLRVKSAYAQGGEQLIPLESIWHGHTVFGYNNVVYDPSYGVDYGEVDECCRLFASHVEGMVSFASTNTIILIKGDAPHKGVKYHSTQKENWDEDLFVSFIEFKWLTDNQVGDDD